MRDFLEGVRRVTVVGAGKSGTASALFLKLRLGLEVLVSEASASVDGANLASLEEAGVAFEVGGHSERAFSCDLMVLSSSVSPSSAAVREAERRGVPLVGELELAWRLLPPVRRLYCVTGTNGKSTTTALIGHLLKPMGEVFVGGNFGNPAINACAGDYDFVVWEVSSYQLHWADSFAPDVGVLTNVEPDHLDWHGSFEAYLEAKLKLIRISREWALYPVELAHRVGSSVRARRAVLLRSEGGVSLDAEGSILWADEEVLLRREGEVLELFRRGELPLLGLHNLENASYACAAVALAEGVPGGFGESLRSFKPLPHRTEEVSTFRGVRFVDDSKGTNVAAAVAALRSIEGRKVVILGGRGKGEDYSPLASAVKRWARGAILIGEEARPISEALLREGFSSFRLARDMDEAVELAFSMAEPGDVVLLSPACASFDMFKNYAHRGQAFREAVRRLIEAHGL